MAQYSNLKAYIEEKIYENGTQAITGDILQDVLKVMTDDLGEFYQMGGVASPSTDPGTPDAKVIYFATEAGTYTNFGGITLAAGEVALLIFETSWTKETLNVLSAANGGVKTANLADGAVTTEKIAGGAVGTAKIANSAVTSGKVADGAIGTAKIADGAIDADKIAANAVESAKIKNGAVTEGKINDGAVTAGKVAANAVTTAKIADDAVTTAKLNDGAVTEDKIATDAVTSGKVKDGAIGTAKIAAGAVTHAKIGAGAVEESNIKDGAVTSDKIANGAVGSDQLAEGAFSAENLADGSVTTDKLADEAVTAEKIADGAVTAGKFANGSVTTIKLGSGAVTTEKIGDGMVTRQKLADSSVGTSKIIDGAVTTDKVADGAITDAKLENPVSVSQNTETGKKELLIGGTPALIVDNIPEAESSNLVKSDGVIKYLQDFTLIGKNNTPNVLTHPNIIAGHKYVLYIRNKDYSYTTDTGGTRWRFRIYHEENGNTVVDFTVPSTNPSSMFDYYLINPTSSWDYNSLNIGIRADAGVNVEMSLIDYSILDLLQKDSQAIENSTNPIEGGAVFVIKTDLQKAIDSTIYNVDAKVPLDSGYYSLQSAIDAIPSADRKKGMLITFAESYTERHFWYFVADSTDSWSNLAFWRKINIDGDAIGRTDFFSIDNSRVTTSHSIGANENYRRTPFLELTDERVLSGYLDFNQYCIPISFYDENYGYVGSYGTDLTRLQYFTIDSNTIPASAKYVILTNFKGNTLQYGGIYYGVKDAILDIEPTYESKNAVESGGIAKVLDKKKVKGQGNGAISLYFTGIITGHKYILYIKNKNWAYTTDTGGTRWRFRLYHQEDGATVYSDTVMSTNPTGVQSQYLINPTSDWDNDTFFVGIRADLGVAVEMQLFDYTFLDILPPTEATIFNMNSYKQSAIDNMGYKPSGNEMYGLNTIPPLCFLHASDIHNVSARYTNIVSVLNNYSQLKWAILTGDLVSEDFAQPFTPYEEAVELATKPVMFVLGNHDCGNPGNLDVDRNGSNLQCYNKYFAGNIDNWGVVHSGTNNYWYKDDDTCKVRIIGLYEYDTDFTLNPEDNTKILFNRSGRAYSQAQINWFISCLSPYNETTNPNGLKDGYGVIIAEHQPEGARQTGDNPFCSPIIPTQWGWDAYYENRQTLPIARIVDAFINKTTLNASITQTGGIVTTLSLVADFTNRDDEQEFICYLGGHQHNDYIGFLTVYPQQLEVQIGCSKYDTSLQDMARKDGSVSQDCMNLVTIDRNQKRIEIVRFGADTSMFMQDRRFISIGYINPLTD